MEHVLSPGGSKAPLMTNAIVIAALRSKGELVTKTAKYEFYAGKEHGALVAVAR